MTKPHHLHFSDCRYGHFAVPDLDDTVGASLRIYGEWAEDEIRCASYFVRPGDIVLDVGANLGTHTLAFASMVGLEGMVIAFEGQPAVATILSYNVVQNGLTDRVLVMNAVVGNEAGNLSLQHDPAVALASTNLGAFSFIQKFLARPSKRSVNLSLCRTTLDSLDLQTCAFLKIDVEGMESDVLGGARTLLKRCKPAVYFEHASGDSSMLQKSMDVLKETGFRFFAHYAKAFNPDNYRKATANIFGSARELNILACPQDCTPPAFLLPFEFDRAETLPAKPA